MSVEIPERFRLPLSEEQFRSALAKGHGRAVLHAAAHGLGGMEDAFLDASLHARSFDPQCEGSRAGWLVDVLAAAAARESPCASADGHAGAHPEAATRVETTVAQRFMSEVGQNKDVWDLQQQCGILRHLAERGHQRARQLLYDLLGREHDAGWLAAGEEIVRLDGEAGFEFVSRSAAELRGGIERFSDELEVLRRSIRPGQSQPKRRQRRDPARASSKRWQARVDKLRQTRACDVIRQLERNVSALNLIPWGQQAPEEALGQVARELFKSDDPTRLARYLRVFQKRGFPRMEPRLLELAAHPDQKVRWLSMWALGNTSDAAVRNLALSLLESGRCQDSQMRLFKRNLREGDWSIMKARLMLPVESDRLHGLLGDLRDVYEENPCAEAGEAMLVIYEHTPCSLCRDTALQRMVEQRCAPAWVVEEATYDCVKKMRGTAN